MKIKCFPLFLAMLLCVSLCACASEPARITDTGENDASTTPSHTTIPAAIPDEGQDDTAQNENGEDTTASFDDLDGLEVDRNLLTVEITIPASMADQGAIPEDLSDSEFYQSSTVNADGSVTLVMSKSQHAELMQQIRESIDQSLAEMVGAEETPNFKEIETNDDYTVFTVKTSSTQLGFSESIASMGFYIFAGLYHVFNGTEVGDVTVKFVNSETGDLLEELHSSDINTGN